MSIGRPWRHGEADRTADFIEKCGYPLEPWQRNLLNRLESASIAEQFNIIIRGL